MSSCTRAAAPVLLLACSMAASSCNSTAPRQPVVASAAARPEVLVEDLEVGAGEKVRATSLVVVDMTGTLPGGTVFYRTGSPQGPWPVDGLVEGLAAGLEGMAAGGRRRVTIPPSLAYGDSPVRDPVTGETIIPPGSTLVYEVELIEVSDAGSGEPAGDGAAP